jgi:ferredoxin-fold anticodon binding domain-containing protein
VGNKIDLDKIREISKEEGKSLAKKLSTKYYEISALLDKNIDKVFRRLIHDMYELANAEMLRTGK